MSAKGGGGLQSTLHYDTLLYFVYSVRDNTVDGSAVDTVSQGSRMLTERDWNGKYEVIELCEGEGRANGGGELESSPRANLTVCMYLGPRSAKRLDARPNGQSS